MASGTVLDDAIRIFVSVGDYISLRQATTSRTLIGQVLSASQDEVRFREFVPMARDIMTRFSLQPLVQSLYPVASQCNITELVVTSAVHNASREQLIDIVYVIPIGELESGMVHMTGASNIYFVRYEIQENNKITNSPSAYYFFHPRLIRPFSVRLFLALNSLASNIKKMLFHIRVSTSTRRSFQMDFPGDAFNYLIYHANEQSVLKGYFTRKQRLVKYYDTLKCESTTKLNRIMYIRILTQSSLASIRRILGIGISVGVAKTKPTKARPTQYCSIGSYLTSIECREVLPVYLTRSPLLSYNQDGIDFFYNVQNNSLRCNVRFTKISVNTAEIATARIPTADVITEQEEPVAFVGALFSYEEDTYEVVSILDGGCQCKSMYDEEVIIELPLDLVNRLVSEFGS